VLLGNRHFKPTFCKGQVASKGGGGGPLQLISKIEQNRHKYWVESDILNRIRASRGTGSRNVKHFVIIKLLSV
jgi:hypothetical protein